MRPELLPPRKVTDEVLLDVLALAGVMLLPEHIAAWAGMERHVAYDWAARVHLHASDNRVKVRDKPSFVQAAEDAWALEWQIGLDRRYGDLVVVCDALKPKRPDAPPDFGIPCAVSLGYPDSPARLLEEIRRHARIVPHEGRPCQ